MSNPAPTINQINAFNATQGTTIDFNIIGGTELVRSNRIYIYDLSDNSLICTHLYVSTESIHELPPNTDGSIVYESGKSSADFVNGAQYYAQIQTFTDIAGTEGGSGLSVAKMFWCLVDPTLTITTIPSTISTTSYNVSATYNANTSVVSNIIQQYQFSLYSATGSLLQSSGVVVGSGTQQGTSTAYDISYNFTGLSVGSSYYVVVDVTTTQGMSVSVQSNTFTVSIDTPTLGEAKVVNNACDGYISVTSNLSGEYGGSASGEIATFETDSVNDVSSLKVSLEPIQDGTPWIGTDHDTTPYLNRAMPTQSNAYNRESGVIIGGTVVWNQLVQYIASGGDNGITYTWNGDGSYTLNGTASANSYRFVCSGIPANHVGLAIAISNSSDVQMWFAGYTGTNKKETMHKPSSVYGVCLYVPSGVTLNNVKVFPQFYDLTAMFGSTIADYIYSLEQATAGAGVAWFRRYFPEDYYPYSANTLQSVQATAHKTYDADGNVLGNYALDSSLTLRGIPKLDANNNLYYDGDTYASDGTVTRKYGVVDLGTLNWNKNTTVSTSKVYFGTAAEIVDAKKSTGNSYSQPILCGKYMTESWSHALDYDGYDKTIALGYKDHSSIVVYDSACANMTAAEFKTAMNGVYLVYELATPTTETAQAYTNPQIVDPDGTEEYVTANSVPVGHDSTYSLVCPISGYDEVSANVVGKNLLDNKTYSGFGYNRASGTAVELTESAIAITQSENGFSYEITSGWQMVNFKTAPLKAGTYHIQVGGADSTSRTSVYVVGVDGKTKGSAYNATGTNIISTYKTLLDGEYILVASGRTNAGTQTLITPQIELGSTATDYEPYQGQTYTADLSQTVYGGTVDLVSGVLTVDRKYISLPTSGWSQNSVSGVNAFYQYTLSDAISVASNNDDQVRVISDALKGATSHDVIGALSGFYSIAIITNKRLFVYVPSATFPNVNSFMTWLQTQDIHIVYELAEPTTYQLTPQQIQTLVGQNNVWSEQGNIELSYHIPITNLLVKRQDVGDVSGNWLTLYSQPITQASDMDFTFIDFTNQYGKTYKYALVPLLTQTQSGVEVEVEGGYTVSDEVQSIFDGVFIADSTGSQKCKANVGYGNVDMNQVVGSITPIGAKYPIVITNSQNQYHNGSISGTIVPDDYYFNGNLSRIDMVNKRSELEQFLTNKRAKIIKDWNGNIWLVMIMSNVACSFDDNYGMGMVSFSADWLEVGDPTHQQDLYNAGLINVGGV